MAKKNSNNSTTGMGVVIVITLAFLGFLFYLANTPPSDPKAAKAEMQKSLKQSQKQLKEADKKAPKADYDFYQLLENNKVEVPKVEAYRSTPREEAIDYQYLLQVASFRSQEDADSLRASLLLEGMPAYTRSINVNNGTWHRVFVGPFDNRSNMNRAQDKLVERRLSPLEFREPKPKG